MRGLSILISLAIIIAIIVVLIMMVVPQLVSNITNAVSLLPDQILSLIHISYIVRCADGTLYTGWTNDLKKRIKAHNLSLIHI